MQIFVANRQGVEFIIHRRPPQYLALFVHIRVKIVLWKLIDFAESNRRRAIVSATLDGNRWARVAWVIGNLWHFNAIGQSVSWKSRKGLGLRCYRQVRRSEIEQNIVFNDDAFYWTCNRVANALNQKTDRVRITITFNPQTCISPIRRGKTRCIRINMRFDA